MIGWPCSRGALPWLEPYAPKGSSTVPRGEGGRKAILLPDYLDKHFGINQITSYRSIDYEKLKGQVEDREVKSAARKALDLKLKQVTQPLKRHLLAEEQAHQAHQLRAVKGPELAAKLAAESSTDTPEYKELSRQVVALKGADLRYETTRLERRKSIEQGHQEIAAIQVQIAGTQAQQSRLEAMIQADMVKMEGQSKRLMDVLRITVRNLFYQGIQYLLTYHV